MPDPRLPQRLPAGSASRHDLVTALIGLLEREQQELTAPRADVLEALAQQKATLCQALQPAPQGTQSAPARDDTRTRELIARAHRLNCANASLLALHRSFGESRLRVLRGSRNDATTYRANGYLRF